MLFFAHSLSEYLITLVIISVLWCNSGRFKTHNEGNNVVLSGHILYRLVYKYESLFTSTVSFGYLGTIWHH